jgi:DNA-binding NarL/FixJ family response regulator
MRSKLDGLNAFPLMRERVPEAAIVVLTLHESLNMARIASHWGISGYVTKSVLTTDLVPVIETLEERENVPYQV